MCGPAFEPDACSPSDSLDRRDGAEAAVNAVYYNRLAALGSAEEREAETQRLRDEYEADIDVLRLAGELVVDDVVEPEDLRGQLIRRFAAARRKIGRSRGGGMA